jgi:cell wall assembly regulator SMI1
VSIEESWARIMTWCRAQAPVTAGGIDPPAGPAALAAAETAIGRSFPADLREWYRLHNGNAQWPYPLVVPGYWPMSLDTIVAKWTMLCRGSQEMADGAPDVFDVVAREAEPAGTMAGLFLPSFIPFADDGSACCCFVDTRPGPRSGCVTRYLREDADYDGPWWDSVAVMLDTVGDSLETGRPIGVLGPTVTDGWLNWEYLS